MRAVVTRVRSAGVDIDGVCVGSISRGLLILLGVGPEDTPETCRKLADKILSPGEKARFDAAENKTRALLTFWVLKEAEAKRTGEGLRGYPNHTDFSLDDPRVTETEGCLVAVMEDAHVI